MKAIIFAEGFNNSEVNSGDEHSKSMVKIGEKPLVFHHIELLAKYDLRDILIVQNPSYSDNEYFIGNGERYGVRINYLSVNNFHSISGVLSVLEENDNDLLFLDGAKLLNINLRRFLVYHYTEQNQCTVAVHPVNYPLSNNLFDINELNNVTGLNILPHNSDMLYSNLADFGVVICSKNIFTELDSTNIVDFTEFYQKLIKNRLLASYRTSEYSRQITNQDELAKVEEDYNRGMIKHFSYEKKQKAIFLDRDGVINVERSYIKTPDELELYPETPGAVKKINESDYHAIVVTNQAIIARNMCSLKDLSLVHKKLEADLGAQNCYIDNLYYCPHHPDKSISQGRDEYKIECDCRKPKPGMLLKAAGDYNIDLKKSFMIGDTERDIIAGRDAGCTTIGVMNGYGVRKASVIPDYFFKDIDQSVNFIVNEPFKWVYEAIQRKTRRVPELILIGGNALTGKSTLATYLKWKYEQAGKRVCKISLDNWLLSDEEREKGNSVFDRFNTTTIVSDIQQILAGMEVRKPTYPKHPDRSPIDSVYSYKGEDIIIIEGVIALSFQELRFLATRLIFTEVNDQVFWKRFQDYYTWRGMGSEEIENLFKKRKGDEFSLIEKDREYADFLVNTSEY